MVLSYLFPEDKKIPQLRMSNDNAARVKEIYAVIKPVRQEYLAKMSTGQMSMDEWDNYVAEIKKLGVEEMVQLLQAAYDEGKVAVK